MDITKCGIFRGNFQKWEFFTCQFWQLTAFPAFASLGYFCIPPKLMGQHLEYLWKCLIVAFYVLANVVTFEVSNMETL